MQEILIESANAIARERSSLFLLLRKKKYSKKLKPYCKANFKLLLTN